MSGLPSYDLEIKASEERRRLHTSVAELKSHVRNSFDVNKQVRKNFGVACAAAALLGLISGYSVTGLFVRTQ
jgi:hypothetical protein